MCKNCKLARVRKRKIKNFILRAITEINFILFLIGLCSIDSIGIGYTISLLLIVIPGLWLTLFIFANYNKLVESDV